MMRKNISKVFNFQTIIGISLLVLLAIFIYGILNNNALPDWWGTNETTNKVSGNINEEVISPQKTIWDLVDLLLVPFVIAMGGYLFNQAQQARNLEFTESQNENQRKISLDRDQEDTLQNYLDKICELLLQRKLNGTKDKVILNLARSRTLTTLRSLNNQYLDIKDAGKNRRKASLARFLYEMNLINGKKSIVNLRRANLEFAYMHSGEFTEVNFEGAFLGEADLRNSNLQDAFLTGVYLTRARLDGAHLERANLTKADLKGANLKGAYLDGTILDDAELQGAIMPDGSIHE